MGIIVSCGLPAKLAVAHYIIGNIARSIMPNKPA